MDITIRKTEIVDEEDVFSLASRLTTSFKVERVCFSKLFLDILNEDKTDLLIAIDSERPIGYILAFQHPAFYANGDVTWVEELYVDEAYRGKGIGKKLMESVELISKKRGSILVALATRRAGDFYKAIGYEESAAYFKKRLE
jgi:GNAT superfamily N-acetyltransferase